MAWESWLLPLHVTLVLLLVLLFSWRGWYAWQGCAVPYAWLRRGVPDGVDMLVLASGTGLAVMLTLKPWEHPWFAAKLLLLLLYIRLGFASFRAEQPRRIRRSAVAGALFTLAVMAVLGVSHSLLVVL